MIKKIIFVTIVPLLLFLTGCSSVTVKHDYDPSADFTKYKTYKLSASKDPDDILSKNQLVLNRFYKALDLALKDKGFEKNETNPDFVVYPHVTTKDKWDIRNWGYGYGSWWGAGPYRGWHGGNIDVRQYTKGTILIDCFA